MTIQPVVKQETKRVAIGVAVMAALMIAVYLIVGQFNASVLLGAILGSAAAIGNFFLMALTVQRATESMPVLPPEEKEDAPQDGEEDDEAKPQPLSAEARSAGKSMQVSYILRMLGLALIAVIAAKVPALDLLATALPMLFPHIVISILKYTHKEG